MWLHRGERAQVSFRDIRVAVSFILVQHEHIFFVSVLSILCIKIKDFTL